jgi:hypothetical protein
MCKSLMPSPPFCLLIVTIPQFTRHIGFLSSLLCLCHINLLLMLSIALMTHLGSKYRDMKYTVFAESTALTNIPLPAKDRYSACHPGSVSCMPSINCLKNYLGIRLSDNGGPKYLRGNVPDLH